MTFVMTPTTDTVAVMNAIKAGHTYAVRITRQDGPAELPRIESFCFAGDTLRVAFSARGDIRFVGQGGALLKEEADACRAFYMFRASDTYVRVEARFEWVTIYLSPLARYSPALGQRPANADYSVPNVTATVLSIAAHALLILALLAVIFLLFRKRKSGRME
jgi:hypothetical protein